MMAEEPGPDATQIEKRGWELHPKHFGDPTFEDPDTGEIVDWVWNEEGANWLPEGYQINAAYDGPEKIAAT